MIIALGLDLNAFLNKESVGEENDVEGEISFEDVDSVSNMVSRLHRANVMVCIEFCFILQSFDREAGNGRK